MSVVARTAVGQVASNPGRITATVRVPSSTSSVVAPVARKTTAATPTTAATSSSLSPVAQPYAPLNSAHQSPQCAEVVVPDEQLVHLSPVPADEWSVGSNYETASTYHYDGSSYYGAPSTCSSALNQKDQNSVTIKQETSVKDAAGAIVKVLDRLCSTIVTALQEQPGNFEPLNRAVKALAVCRKYVTDAEPGVELSFIPVQRSDSWGRPHPHLFSFLAFKSTLVPSSELQQSTDAEQQHETTDTPSSPQHGATSTSGASEQVHEVQLHVSSMSDPEQLAHTLVNKVTRAGQAVMKAGGGCALYVAMTAVLRARHVLKTAHSMDVMMVPQWITEDTTTTLGRESKFLQFTLLPSGLHGVMPAAEGATRPPAIVMLQPQTTTTAAAAEC